MSGCVVSSTLSFDLGGARAGEPRLARVEMTPRTVAEAERIRRAGGSAAPQRSKRTEGAVAAVESAHRAGYVPRTVGGHRDQAVALTRV